VLLQSELMKGPGTQFSNTPFGEKLAAGLRI
jgi:hypothetical protein